MADKKQTDKPTNQQTNTHYSFIGIDIGDSVIYLTGLLPGPVAHARNARGAEFEFANQC